RAVSMSHPANVRIAADGTMYVSAALDQIVRVGNDGIARIFGGDLSVPGLSQTECDRTKNSCTIRRFDLEPSQDLTFVTSAVPLPTVRRATQTGIISAVTSPQGSPPGCTPLGAPAAVTCVDPSAIWGFGHFPTGDLLVGVNFNRVLRISARPFENAVPSEDGSEIFIFDSTGRHLKTLNARTLTTKYEIQYDPTRLLSAIVDGSGNRTPFKP